MDAVTAQLNAMGKFFVDFALPMLVQAGALILILLGLDLILRRRVRAVVRYWILTLVLVKLLLPTTLSSPTGLGYWIGWDLSGLARESPPPAHPPRTVETPFGAAPAETEMEPLPRIDLSAAGDAEPLAVKPAATPAPAPVPITWRAIALLVWLAVVAGMTAVLIHRSVYVKGLMGRSALERAGTQAGQGSVRISDILADCRARLGIKRHIRLRLSSRTASPAVCGLFRPVVLLPESLPERLNPRQLKAVLLHELAHVKRGDLWVNLVQAVLQIAYFYNPLLWLANAVIRRVREQAVDEMVLVAMGESAPEYPDTLVNVARLSLTRPALILRLIGVVESKKALTGRIRHILTRPLPRTAKLGVIGLIVILVAAAVLLPMAGAQPEESAPAEDKPAAPEAETKPALLEGLMAVRVVDADGRPVGGARLGGYVRVQAVKVNSCRLRWMPGYGGRIVTNDDGEALVAEGDLFQPWWPAGRKAVLIAIHELSQIGAMAEVGRKDIGRRLTLKLQPLCRVHGVVASPELTKLGRPLGLCHIYLCWGEHRPMSQTLDSGMGFLTLDEKPMPDRFEFLLPPGRYKLHAYGFGKGVAGAGTLPADPAFEVRPGQRELDLGTVNLPAGGLAKLLGKPAPELRQIREWVNGGPVTLAGLKGKVVLLNFRDSPFRTKELVTLQEKYKAHGLVVIAIQDNSITSAAALRAKFAELRKKDPRTYSQDPTFLIALDGGKSAKIRIEGVDYEAPGANFAAYGMHVYMTSVLIDREGRVACSARPDSDRSIKDLERLLGLTKGRALPGWRKRFDAVYRLEKGEVLKRIAPPFIPEREAYYQEELASQARLVPTPPDYFTFRWNGKLGGPGLGFTGGRRPLRYVLVSNIGLATYEFEGPEGLLELDVPGDWIVRKGASQAARMKALEQIIRKQLKRPIRFEQRQVVREVAVARGRFQFRPISGSRDDSGVHIYADTLDPLEGSGGGSGTMAKFLRHLGSRLNLTVIDDTKTDENEHVSWYDNRDSTYTRMGNRRAEQVNKVLANLSRQMSLNFFLERRKMQVWFVRSERGGAPGGGEPRLAAGTSQPGPPAKPAGSDEVAPAKKAADSAGESKPARRAAVFVLDNCDPDFRGKAGYSDNLTCLDAAGEVIFRITGLNNCESIGSSHAIAVDAGRGWVWVAENVGGRIRKYDFKGKELLVLKDAKAHAIAVQPDTGNLWVLRYSETIYGECTEVYGPSGRKLASYPFTGFDIAYDGKEKAFWIVAKDLLKVTLDGKVALRTTVAKWCACSVAVDDVRGLVWVAVRDHPDVAGSKNKLVSFGADGRLRATIPLGQRDPFRVAVDRRSGTVWVAQIRKGVLMVSSDGKQFEQDPLPSLSLDVDETGNVWVVMDTEIVKLDAKGEVLARSPLRGKTSQAWIATVR